MRAPVPTTSKGPRQVHHSIAGSTLESSWAFIRSPSLLHSVPATINNTGVLHWKQEQRYKIIIGVVFHGWKHCVRNPTMRTCRRPRRYDPTNQYWTKRMIPPCVPPRESAATNPEANTPNRIPNGPQGCRDGHPLGSRWEGLVFRRGSMCLASKRDGYPRVKRIFPDGNGGNQTGDDGKFWWW